MSELSSHTSLKMLPNEILFSIFLNCDLKSILNAKQVDRRFRFILKDEVFWRILCGIKFGNCQKNLHSYKWFIEKLHYDVVDPIDVTKEFVRSTYFARQKIFEKNKYPDMWLKKGPFILSMNVVNVKVESLKIRNCMGIKQHVLSIRLDSTYNLFKAVENIYSSKNKKIKSLDLELLLNHDREYYIPNDLDKYKCSFQIEFMYRDSNIIQHIKNISFKRR